MFRGVKEQSKCGKRGDGGEGEREEEEKFAEKSRRLRNRMQNETFLELVRWKSEKKDNNFG